MNARERTRDKIDWTDIGTSEKENESNVEKEINARNSKSKQ